MVRQPVVGHLAVGDVGIRGDPVGHIGDPADQHRSVDTVALQVGQLFGGVQAEMGLADDVSLGARRVSLDVGVGALTGHHGQGHDVAEFVDVLAVLVLLDARKVLPIMLRQLVHDRQWRRDVAVGRDEFVRHHCSASPIGYECFA